MLNSVHNKKQFSVLPLGNFTTGIGLTITGLGAGLIGGTLTMGGFITGAGGFSTNSCFLYGFFYWLWQLGLNHGRWFNSRWLGGGATGMLTGFGVLSLTIP